MEDRTKQDQESKRPKSDPETQKKPAHGSQEGNRPQQQKGNVQPGEQQHQDREKQSA